MTRLDERDAATLAGVRRRDVESLGRLYDRYGSGSYRLAVALVGDPALAETVVEDSFVAVWRRASPPRRTETVATWLAELVTRKARRHSAGSTRTGTRLRA